MDTKELFDEIINDDDFIEHYGVLGMKWGVSRAAGAYAKSQANRYGKPIERHKKVKAARKDARDAYQKKNYGKAKGAVQKARIDVGKALITSAEGTKQVAKSEKLLKSAVTARLNKQGKEAFKKQQKVQNMTTEQLQAATKRMQLEKQYKDISKKETGKGAKFVKDVVIGGAKVAATTYVTTQATLGIKTVVSQAVKKGR